MTGSSGGPQRLSSQVGDGLRLSAAVLSMQPDASGAAWLSAVDTLPGQSGGSRSARLLRARWVDDCTAVGTCAGHHLGASSLCIARAWFKLMSSSNNHPLRCTLQCSWSRL